MSISGNLEDLPFIDVIQLLHVAKKSGTLELGNSKGQRAAIICRDGDIVGAIHPSSHMSIGKILLEMKLVEQEAIDEAVDLIDVQNGDVKKQLISTLIELGYLNENDGGEALKQLIHSTMAEIISWKSGTFHFDVNKTGSDDKYRHSPDTFSEEWSLDIKGALMEALRIFDERNRDQQEKGEKEKKRLKQQKQKEAQRLLQLESDEEIPIKEELEDTVTMKVGQFREAVLMTTDGFLKNSFKTSCKERRMFSFVSAIERDLVREIETCNMDGTATVFVADLSNDNAPGLGPSRILRSVRRIKYLRPELPMVVLTSSLESSVYLEAIELGARTVLCKPSEKDGDKAGFVQEMKDFVVILSESVRRIFKDHHELQKSATQSRQQISSLKRRILEIQDRKTSPDVSLVVLQYVAEYLERGIIFLVRKKDLIGLGSFGVDANGDTISAAAMKLKIPLDEPSVFKKVVSSGMVFQGPTNDPLVERILFNTIGNPRSNHVLVLPLKTENRTRALVYGDFGRLEAEPVKADVFEILASQAGMAIEIALQRNRIARHTEKFPPPPTFSAPGHRS